MKEDIFRKVYTALPQERQQKILKIKELCEAVYAELDINNRETKLARTRLEECSMWATKGVVVDG